VLAHATVLISARQESRPAKFSPKQQLTREIFGRMVTMKTSRRHQTWTDVAVFENLNDGKALETFLMDHRLESRTYDDKLFRYFCFCVRRA